MRWKGIHLKELNGFRSTPSDPTDQKHADPTDQKPAEPGSVLQSKESIKGIRPTFILVGLLLVVYFVVGFITFYVVMDQISGKRTNRVLDAMYFIVITMTSVMGILSQIACAFVFLGMGLMALFISKVAGYLVEKQKVLFFRAIHNGGKSDKVQILLCDSTSCYG